MSEDKKGTTLSGSNPFDYPERLLFRGLTYNGANVFDYPVSADPITHVQRIRKLQMRYDDILITAFPKCGTHWVFEMLHMLLRGTTDYAARPKEFNMLEFTDDLTTLDQMTSPRLLNTHLYTAHLPEEVVKKRVKLIHLIRQPKDVLVSMYYHEIQNESGQLNFDKFLRGYMTENYGAWSHQANYLRQFSKFEDENGDQPIFTIYFEDLKKDPASILQGLAHFVGVQASRGFCDDVASAFGFDRLKQMDAKRDLPEHLRKSLTNGYQIYRKGIVGDWKNTFTDAQSEMFDQFWAKQVAMGLPYKF